MKIDLLGMEFKVTPEMFQTLNVPRIAVVPKLILPWNSFGFLKYGWNP
jgi:hypothetical protein